MDRSNRAESRSCRDKLTRQHPLGTIDVVIESASPRIHKRRGGIDPATENWAANRNISVGINRPKKIVGRVVCVVTQSTLSGNPCQAMDWVKGYGARAIRERQAGHDSPCPTVADD